MISHTGKNNSDNNTSDLSMDTDTISHIGKNNGDNNIKVNTFDLSMDTPVNYDSVDQFYSSLGFSQQAVENIKKSHPNCHLWSNFGVHDIIPWIVAATDYDPVYSPDDLKQAFVKFGIDPSWADIYTHKMGRAFADQIALASLLECINDRLLVCM